jgi:hypothetical protein
MSSQEAGAPSLRDRQVLALLTLLNFNVAPSHSALSNSGSGPLAGLSGSSSDPSSSAPLPTWKVLVLDQRAQDVLATTLRVQDLRDSGVTLHMCVCGHTEQAEYG